MVVGWLINVTSFHKRGLLVIGCDIANYKPASRGAESIGEETFCLNTCYMLAVTSVRLHAPPLELSAVYQLLYVLL